MKLSTLFTTLVASLLLTGCMPIETSTGTESGMAAVHLTNVTAASFSVDPLDVAEDGTISNGSTDDLEDYAVTENTDLEVTILDRTNGAIKELNWDEFYTIWSQTDAFSEDTIFDFLYQDTTVTDSATGEELNHTVTIRINERS